MTITHKHGLGLLQDSSLNKSTAFSEAEKQALALLASYRTSLRPTTCNYAG